MPDHPYGHPARHDSPWGEGRPRPPAVTTTAVVSVLLGPFGAIPAYRDSRRAQRVGAAPGRYWVAFAAGLAASVVLYGLLTVALVIGILAAVF